MLAHSSERVNSDSEGDASKVETQKRKHSVHAYFSKNQKRSILRSEKYGDLTTTEHKVLNEGRESRNSVKPKLHWRRRRIYESLQKPSQKPQVFHTYNLLEFCKKCEELPWNHRTTTLRRSETSGIADGKNFIYRHHIEPRS